MKLNNITDIKSKIENYKISFSDIKKIVNAIKQSVDSKVADGLIDTKVVAQKDFYGFTNKKMFLKETHSISKWSLRKRHFCYNKFYQINY